MAADALESIFLIGAFIATIIGVAWLISRVGKFWSKREQISTGAGGQVKKPLHISLLAYIFVVVVLSAVIPSLNSMAFIIVVFALWPAAAIGIIPIAIINKRYYKIVGEQTKDTTTVKAAKGFYSILYWVGLVAFSVFSTFVLFNGILEGNSALLSLFQSVGDTGVTVVFFGSMPVFLLLYHGMVSLIRKSTS